MQVSEPATSFSTQPEAELKYLPVDELSPHPDNPRISLCEETVEDIRREIEREGAFSKRHAPTVRPNGDDYQIISGHQRTEAALRAGVDKVPAWVEEMSDEEAYMRLVLDNTQDELKKLEIGLHALKVAGRGKRGRGNKGDGLKAYAERMGFAYQSVKEWAKAAEVYKREERSSLLEISIQALYEISKAPETLWKPLVDALINYEWSVRETRHYRQKVEEFDIPRTWQKVFLPYRRVIRRYLDTKEFSPRTVERLVNLADNTIDRIHTYDYIDHAEYEKKFRHWLGEYMGRDAWDPRKLKEYQRTLQAEIDNAELEAQRQWALGNWRDHVSTVDDGSVRLVLTDPPYGLEYQSDRRVDRRKERRHDKIAGDEDDAGEELHDAMKALYAKCAGDAHVLVFTHWRTEADMMAVLERAGYTVRGSLIWVKNNHGMGDRDTTFAPQHERIIHAVKGSPTLFEREADVLKADKIISERHPTEKPVDLLERLIRCTTAKGELVADPFGGVASTLVAAHKCDRTAWGAEINEQYHAAGEGRLAQ